MSIAEFRIRQIRSAAFKNENGKWSKEEFFLGTWRSWFQVIKSNQRDESCHTMPAKDWGSQEWFENEMNEEFRGFHFYDLPDTWQPWTDICWSSYIFGVSPFGEYLPQCAESTLQ